MVSRGWLFAGLHMRPNAQNGISDGAGQHFGRCTPGNTDQPTESVQNLEETRIWIHEAVIAYSLLARPPGGHYIALCPLEAAISDCLCK
jgi:hypothetical protein